jgi:hypothetical protein
MVYSIHVYVYTYTLHGIYRQIGKKIFSCMCMHGITLFMYICIHGITLFMYMCMHSVTLVIFFLYLLEERITISVHGYESPLDFTCLFQYKYVCVYIPLKGTNGDVLMDIDLMSQEPYNPTPLYLTHVPYPFPLNPHPYTLTHISYSLYLNQHPPTFNPYPLTPLYLTHVPYPFPLIHTLIP